MCSFLPAPGSQDRSLVAKNRGRLLCLPSEPSHCFFLLVKCVLVLQASKKKNNKKRKLVYVKPYADILMFFEGATVSLCGIHLH